LSYRVEPYNPSNTSNPSNPNTGIVALTV